METALVQFYLIAMQLDRKLATALALGWDTSNLRDLIRENAKSIAELEAQMKKTRRRKVCR